MASNADRYTYRVTWSPDDEEYVGLCAEFPSLSHLDETSDLAWRGIHDLVHRVCEDMLSNKETPPKPISLQKFTGKFMTRVSPELH